jgi:hypothetical protein
MAVQQSVEGSLGSVIIGAIINSTRPQRTSQPRHHCFDDRQGAVAGMIENDQRLAKLHIDRFSVFANRTFKCAAVVTVLAGWLDDRQEQGEAAIWTVVRTG